MATTPTADAEATASFKHTPTTGEFYYRDILWNRYTTPEILQEMERFHYSPRDVVVATFPRSGTTLTQEIVWHIEHRHEIYKDMKLAHIDDRFPFLEFNRRAEDPALKQQPWEVCAAQLTDTAMKDQHRLIKTHLPPQSFLKSRFAACRSESGGAAPRCILVMRNPKDVAVSLFHFYRGLPLFGPWPGEWPEFFEMFMRGFTKCGSWFAWQQEAIDFYLEQRQQGGQVLLLTYEQLVQEPAQTIERIAGLMGVELTPAQLDIIGHNCKFDNMFKQEATNAPIDATGFHFIRKGKVGNWRELFTEEQSQRLEAALAQRFDAKSVDVTFHYG